MIVFETIHAILLCWHRLLPPAVIFHYLKGRNWYDFNWYIKQGTRVNLPHLQAALFQWGPWADKKIEISLKWLKQALIHKAAQIDWQDAAKDVQRFLGLSEQHSLSLWSEKFFTHKILEVQTTAPGV